MYLIRLLFRWPLYPIGSRRHILSSCWPICWWQCISPPILTFMYWVAPNTHICWDSCNTGRDRAVIWSVPPVTKIVYVIRRPRQPRLRRQVISIPWNVDIISYLESQQIYELLTLNGIYNLYLHNYLKSPLGLQWFLKISYVLLSIVRKLMFIVIYCVLYLSQFQSCPPFTCKRFLYSNNIVSWLWGSLLLTVF